LRPHRTSEKNAPYFSHQARITDGPNRIQVLQYSHAVIFIQRGDNGGLFNAATDGGKIQ